MAIGHPDGRQLASPFEGDNFEGDNDVRPNGFDLVIFKDAAGLVDQTGRVDDDECTTRLARKACRPDHQR